MISMPAAIKAIRQKDNYCFTIDWTDGMSCDYRLSQLQRQCPCAKCHGSDAGKPVAGERAISEDLRAKKISSVGRYALRIEFTSGCSTGIYSFSMLRKMAGDHV